MNDIQFNRRRDGLAKPLPGEDHVSGLLIFSATLPSGFGTDNIRQILSIEHAESLGIAKGSVGFAALYYHIDCFFKVNPGAILYVGIYTTPVPLSFAALANMQNFADGKIRQFGIYLTEDFDVAQLALAKTVLTALETEHKPAVCIIGANIKTVSDLSTLPDLKALDTERVSVVIGQDGAAEGAALYVTNGKSVTSLGATLGALSLASVHENIGWVAKFNMVKGLEFDVPAFGNGVLFKNSLKALQTTLDTKGYIYLGKHIGYPGTYHNDSYTATAANNDFNSLEAVRTMDKAVRGIRSYMIPQINGPLRVDEATGKLLPDTVAYLESIASLALEQMESAGELSGYAAVINPDQNVVSTGQLEVSIVNVPVGVMRKTIINIGYGSSL